MTHSATLTQGRGWLGVVGEIEMLRQLSDLKRERGGYLPRSVKNGKCLLENLITMIGSMDALPFGRGCESRIDHYLADRVP